MEIPQNILKELEDRKLKAMLDSDEPATDAEEPTQTTSGVGAPTPLSADVGVTPVMSIRGFIQQPSAEAPKATKARFKFPFFGRKNKATLASVETEQRSSFNIPVSPVNSHSTPLIESYPHSPTGSELFFEYISKVAVYLAIFLTPLFFMNSSDTLGLSKQLLISIFALVAIAGWIAKIISSGSISWRNNITLLPALLVAASAVLSSFFSSSFWVSFLGDTGRFAFAGISILSYLVIFYVAIQSFNKKDLAVAIWLWLSSVFLASFFGITQMFGKFIFPMAAYKTRTFNTVGSSFHLAIFAASSIPFLAVLFQFIKNVKLKILAVVMLVTQIAFAVLVDFRVAWVSLAVSGIFLMLVNFKNPVKSESAQAAHREYQKSIVLPLFLIVLSIAMWFVVITPINGFQIPTEVNPSYKASYDIALKTLKNWPVFGSGLETFPYVYAKYKDSGLNQTDYWGVNFNDSTAEGITWATTSGAFGTVALLAFIIIFSIYALKRIGTRSDLASGFSSSSAKAGIFASWIFILATKFSYPTSLPLEFLFWLLPALFVVSCSVSESENEGQWRYFFQAGSFKTLGIFFVLMVFLLGTLIGTYFSVKRFAAERVFIKALMTENKAENRDGVIDNITNAIISDPYEVRYFRVLTQVLFQKMNDIVVAIQNRPEAERKATAEESALLQNLTVRSINSVQRSVALDPNNVGVSTDAAESYKGLVSLVQGADDLAIQNYERASEMEPINPYIKTQLGQLYLVKSNLFGDGTGTVDQEIAKKARGLFEEAVKLNSNYANAWYFLALMQDAAGEKAAALNNFKILGNANPSNQLIAQIIKNLEAGAPALGYPPKPATPPQPSEKGVPPETTAPAPTPKTTAPK